MNTLRTIGLSLTLLVLPAGASQAVDMKPLCGSFELIGGHKDVAFVDNGENDVDIGDRRAGWRQLNDNDGNPVGEVHFAVTVTKAAENGDTVIGNYVIALPQGWLTAETLYERRTASDVGQSAASAALVVTGGIGPYGGVTGLIEIEPGDAPVYRFDIACRE